MQNLTSLSQSSAGNLTVKKNRTFNIGEFSSVTAGFGSKISSSITAIERKYFDDGGVALTTGNLRASLSRLLITTAVTGGSFTARALMGHTKVHASIISSGPIAGVEGYLECSGTGHIDRATGVRGVADLPSGAVIHTSGVLSAFMGYSVDLGGTHTGKAVILDVPTPLAGTWDALLNIDATSGCTTAGTTKTTPGGVGVWLNAIVAGTAYYIPCYASTTT
jgi:hypothetical protein